jgi:hypothetical protein
MSLASAKQAEVFGNPSGFFSGEQFAIRTKDLGIQFL